jgi:hypothetical protein
MSNIETCVGCGKPLMNDGDPTLQACDECTDKFYRGNLIAGLIDKVAEVMKKEK